MKKFFESKIALIVFIIISFALILLLSKDLIAAAIYSFALGGFTGFCYTNQYWKIKFDKLKEIIEDWKRENKHN